MIRLLFYQSIPIQIMLMSQRLAAIGLLVFTSSLEAQKNYIIALKKELRLKEKAWLNKLFVNILMMDVVINASGFYISYFLTKIPRYERSHRESFIQMRFTALKKHQI